MTSNNANEWKIDVMETSIGVYRVSATSKKGAVVEVTGFDVEQLTNECWAKIKEIENPSPQ